MGSSRGGGTSTTASLDSGSRLALSHNGLSYVSRTSHVLLGPLQWCNGRTRKRGPAPPDSVSPLYGGEFASSSLYEPAWPCPIATVRRLCGKRARQPSRRRLRQGPETHAHENGAAPREPTDGPGDRALDLADAIGPSRLPLRSLWGSHGRGCCRRLRRSREEVMQLPAAATRRSQGQGQAEAAEEHAEERRAEGQRKRDRSGGEDTRGIRPNSESNIAKAKFINCA